MSLCLISAIRRGDIDDVQRILDAGADPCWRLPAESDHGAFLDQTTPLMVAAAAPGSNAEIVRLLLERGADPFDVSAGKVSATWYACGGGTGFPLSDANLQRLEPDHVYRNWGGGDVDRLRVLLDSGGDPNESAANGRSCVYEACSLGDAERLRLLIERGGRVEPAQPPATHELGGNFKGALAGISLGQYQLVPLFAAAQTGSLESVKLIVEAGFPPDFALGNENALSQVGSARVAAYLWDLGVRPGTNAFGFDAMDDAIESDNLPVLEFLASRAEATSIQSKLLTASGVRMNPRAVRLFLKLGADANMLDRDYGSPLHYACWQGDGNGGRNNSVVEETIQALIDGGADPNQFSKGHHPLHEAASGDWGSPTAAQVLLRNGAQVDPRNGRGETPLMLAAQQGEVQVVRVLLENGADRSLRDNRGKTPLDHARAHLKIWKGPAMNIAKKGLDKVVGSFGLPNPDTTLQARSDAEAVVKLLEERTSL